MPDKKTVKCPICFKNRIVGTRMFGLIKTGKSSGRCQSCSLIGNKHGYKDGRIYDKTMYGSRLYWVWSGMKSRCYNPKDIGFSRYGGRGIVVCNEWQYFGRFLDDMKKTYKPDLTLDRIDNNGNYNKKNCRWATRKEQAQNTRNVEKALRITFNGITQTIKGWSKQAGIKRTTLRMRVMEYNWPIEKALTKGGHFE